MDRWMRLLPQGVADRSIIQQKEKRAAENALLELFAKSGYGEVKTPTFEYYEVFTGTSGHLRAEGMIKFIDDTGRILVLRPDLTMPIARMAAGSMQNQPLPLRLCYVEEAYAYTTQRAGQRREYTQAGIELLGSSHAESDAEVIATAIAAMQALGLRGVQLDIGQVEFFNGLMEEAQISPEDTELLRGLIDNKNMLQLELVLGQLAVSEKVRNVLHVLPNLYGGYEILDVAAGIGNNARSLSAVENLRTIYNILDEMGYADCISFDFGLLQSLNYYTGIIFKGMTEKLGTNILSGGRYDKLLADFGMPMPAIGFALWVDDALQAMQLQQVAPAPVQQSIVVGYSPAARMKALRLITQMRAQGEIVEVFFEQDTRALCAYAQAKGAKRAVYANGEGTLQTVWEAIV